MNVLIVHALMNSKFRMRQVYVCLSPIRHKKQNGCFFLCEKVTTPYQVREKKSTEWNLFFFSKTNLNCFNVWNEISLYKPFSGGKSIKWKRFVFKCWKFYLMFSNKWTNLKQKKKKRMRWDIYVYLQKQKRTLQFQTLQFLSDMKTILTWLFRQTLIAYSSLLQALPKKVKKKIAFDEILW